MAAERPVEQRLQSQGPADERRASADLSGQRLGHYLLLEQIGAGGMGRVYRARDERLEREVAIKILPPHSLSNDETRKRFRREALALSKVNHPNIATIHDFDTCSMLAQAPETADQTGGEVDFLVMEHIKGTGLDERMALGPLPEQEVLRLGLQLAEGLAAAHAAGVLHRDLKPANLRVTEEGRLKILDFGLAKLAYPTNDTATTESISHHFAGTFPYMAPEQLLGRTLDSRTDIYAAGNVLYEIAAGRRPHATEQGSRLLEAILHLAPVPPRTLNARISVGLESVIMRCLEKAPENRYPTAMELALELRRLGMSPAMAGSGKTSPLAGTLVERPSVRQKLARSIPLAVIVVITVGAFVAVLDLRHKVASEWSRADKFTSLAVLPLENLSSDPGQDYFADGMTDELISRVARLSGLRVISRTSVMQYKGTRKTVPEIGKDLRVDALIEGSVTRAGTRVRITAELIDAAHDQHLWGDSYNRNIEDVLALQDEVAEAISNRIGHVLAGATEPARKIDPQAYEAYLRGRYYWNKRSNEDLKRALDYFHDAVRREPGYAAAYAGIADCYMELEWGSAMPADTAFAEARAAVGKALELDQGLVEAHATSGQLLLTANWNWKGAESEFKRAIAINPSYAMAHHWYGLELAQEGRVEEAKHELELARELDPVPAINGTNVAWAYYVGRDYEMSIRLLRQVLEQDPDFWVAHWGLGSSYVQTQQYAEAVEELQRAVTLSQRDPSVVSSLAVAKARAGKQPETRRLLKELLDRSQHGTVSGTDIAMVYLALGEHQPALAWLEKAYAAHAHDLLSLDAEPWWDSLRGESRFQELRRKIGLGMQ